MRKTMKTSTKLVVTGLVAILCCSIANAQTFLVYSNDFTAGSGSQALGGLVPNAGATGLAGGTAGAAWADVVQDQAGLLGDGTMGDLGGATELLPFTPQSGYLYRMTATVILPQYNNGAYVSIGFGTNMPLPNTVVWGAANGTTSDARPTSVTIGGTDWALLRSGDQTGRTAYMADQWFAGPQPYNGTTPYPLFSADVITNAGTYTWEVNLNTSGTQWVGSAYIDGTQVGSDYTYASNPSIVAAMLQASGSPYMAGDQYLNWGLTATVMVPEPTTFALVGLGLSALLLLRRKRAHA